MKTGQIISFPLFAQKIDVQNNDEKIRFFKLLLEYSYKPFLQMWHFFNFVH